MVPVEHGNMARMTQKITGRDLINAGLRPGDWFGRALSAGNSVLASGGSYDAAIEAARSITPTLPLRRKPEVEIHANIRAENAIEQANIDKVMDSMRRLIRTPVVRAAAVMPDACLAGHPGTIPVGGVVVSEGIHPGMHSADVCCSMAISVMPGVSPKELLDAVQTVTRFGRGGRQHVIPPSRGVLEAFRNNSFLGGAVDLAVSHHATQGDGNHFAYVGTIKSTGETALVTHHGSRAPGAVLYHAGMEVAERFRDELSPATMKCNGWIPADTREGEDYWDALQIVRAWTKENHFKIHDLAAQRVGGKVADRFWNEHNFVFRRSDGLFYHGKGATPAFGGWASDATDLTLVPLNMAEPILITRGTNAANGLGFSPHGAGRNLSRMRIVEMHGDRSYKEIHEQETAGLDARFFSGAPDITELPSAYKNAATVKAQITEFGLAEVVEEIMPYGSLMAGEVPTPELLDKFGITRDVPAMHYGHSFEDGVEASASAVTDHERLTYGSGECHLLSVAMHRQTGWEMLAVIAGMSPSEGGDEDGTSLAHCYAVEGDLLWDVNGVRHWDDVMSELDDLYGDDFELVHCADEVALDELVGLEDADAAIDAASPVATRVFEARQGNASRFRR
jgi:RNA-splicing ligase RtcB